MALRERWYSVDFAHGESTEENKKTRLPGYLEECSNGVFTERVTIVKRPGTRLLDRQIATSSGYAQISGAIGLTTRDDENDLVMLTSDDRICSYDDSGGRWVHRGDWLPVCQKLDYPARGPNEGWDTTQCSLGNVQMWAWEDLRGGVFARLRNLNTGVSYGPEFRVGGHLGRQPTALTVGNLFHLYFTSGTLNTMNVAVINPANPTSTSASFSQLHPAIDPLNPTYCVDTYPGWNSSRIAVSISGSTFIAVVQEAGSIGASGSSPWPNPVFYDRSVINPDLCISGDGLTMAVTVKGDQASGGTIRSCLYNPNSFAILSASVLLDSAPAIVSSATTVNRIAAGFHGISGSAFLSAYSQMSASEPSLRHLRRGTALGTTPYTQVSSGSFCRHTSLTTRPFRFENDVGRAYFWGTQISPLQTTDFLLRDDGQVCATSRYGTAWPIVSGVLGRVEVISDADKTVGRHGVNVRDQFVAVSGGFVNDNGTTTNMLSTYGDRHPGLLSLTWHGSSSWKPVDVAGTMYMPGGYLGKYDGSSVTENGFLLMTENLSAVLGSGSVGVGRGILQMGNVLTSGPAATASFIYEVLPVSFDAQGNKEYGACAQLLPIFPSGTTSAVQNSASLSWNSIAHTRRDGTQAPDIRFEVYRTGWTNTAGFGAPLLTRQRIDDPAYPILNSTTSDTITFVDTVPESVRSLGDISYTNIGSTHVPSPACSFLAAQGDRLYLAGIEGAPLKLIPSKLRLGGAIALAEEQFVEVDSNGGPITAIAGMDEKVVLFKDRRVFVTTTEGPDNSLLDTTPFRNPELVSSDVGAPEPATIVQVAGTTVQGLVFRSNRGFRSITRGIDLVDIGARARRYDDLQVVGGLSPGTAEECRFYTAEGTTVILNTRYNEWSVFPDQTAVAACSWMGRPTYVGSDGRVRVEASGTWLDNSTPYPMSLATGWLPIQGLQGLTRVRRLFVLGDFHSHHKLKVEMAVDYRDAWIATRTIDTRTALGEVQYGGPTLGPSGSDGTYGVGPYGGRDPVYQFEVELPIQRMQTVRFRFSDIDQALSGSYQNGRSFSLTEMKLLVATDTKAELPARKRK